MKIEAGKYYKNRNGRKVGPIKADSWNTNEYPFSADGYEYPFSADGYDYLFTPSGIYGNHRDAGSDLIDEWKEVSKSPIQEEVVTKKNLVPGIFGPVSVVYNEGKVGVSLFENKQPTSWAVLNRQQMRDAARILGEIADWMESDD